MAPKYHPTPLSGGDRKALAKELGKARAMASMLATQSAEMRAKGGAMIQQADRLLCESWNERMWSDGEPIDPSPTIDQAVNGGFPWLEIRCARCKTPSDVDLAAMKHPPTTFVHDLASRLRCRKCTKVGRRSATRYNWLGSHATFEPKTKHIVSTRGVRPVSAVPSTPKRSGGKREGSRRRGSDSDAGMKCPRAPRRLQSRDRLRRHPRSGQ